MSHTYLSNQPKLEKLLTLSKMPWQKGNSIFKSIYDQVLLTESRYQESLGFRKQLEQQSIHFKKSERRWAKVGAKYAYINDDKKALACLMRRTTYKELNIEVYEQIIQQAIIAYQIKQYLLFLEKNVNFLINLGNSNVSIEELEGLNNRVIADSNDIESALSKWRTSMAKTRKSKREQTKLGFGQFVESIDIDKVDSDFKKELNYLKKRLTVLNGKLIIDKRW